MPEKVLLQKVAEPNHQRKLSRVWHARPLANAKQEDDILQDVVRDHALDYFLGHGGKIEDWNEDEDRRIREIMLKRWQDSDWGQARKTVQWDTGVAKKWIGTSFDVGVFLGVNLLDETASRSFRNPGAGSAASSRIRPAKTPAATASETFVTARSEFTNASGQAEQGIPPPSSKMGQGTSDTTYTRQTEETANRDDHSADSTTALLKSQIPSVANGTAIPPLSETRPTSSILRTPAPAQADSVSKTLKPKGKAVRVHYADVPVDETPAPPREVLARTGSEYPNTSAAAAQRATVENQTPWGDVIMRGTRFELLFCSLRRRAPEVDVQIACWSGSRIPSWRVCLSILTRNEIGRPAIYRTSAGLNISSHGGKAS